MQELFIGETIRRKRLEAGLTQEKLCEGLCDTPTLSRIENGKQAPSRNVATALLQRLGLPHDRYYTFLTENEAEVDALRTKIDGHIVRFLQSLGWERQQVRLEAVEYLDRLEAAAGNGGNLDRQYILTARTVLGDEDRPYGFAERMDMLLEAIRLTIPQFDVDALDDRLYSITEMDIISQIAKTYSDAGQHEKAAGIFHQLLTYVREHDQNITRPSRYVSPAALNYAQELCLMGRCEDALEAAELGRRTCLGYGYCQSLPGLLSVMAECQYAMGESEQSRMLYCQAYYLFKETGNACGLAHVGEEIRNRFGAEFLPREVCV